MQPHDHLCNIHVHGSTQHLTASTGRVTKYNKMSPILSVFAAASHSRPMDTEDAGPFRKLASSGDVEGLRAALDAMDEDDMAAMLVSEWNARR